MASHQKTGARGKQTISRRAGAQELGSVAWTPLRDLNRPEWISIGHRLGRIGRCNQWWLGDWLRYGTTKWGEKYADAARITGYDARSLANMASLAAAFQLSRRRDNLTWSHHAAVVALPVEAQEAWLDRTTSERLSVSDLRVELRAWQRAEELSSGSTADSRSRNGAIVCPRCGHRIEAVNVRNGEEEEGHELPRAPASA
jgi:hypothetical protein